MPDAVRIPARFSAGRTSNVFVYWWFLPWDHVQWQVVSGKRSVTSAVLDGTAEEPGESERATAVEVMDMMLAEHDFEER
jgi:hypothetical protein